MTRVLAVCADDFGLTQGISEGIAELAHAGRINLVSCMPQAPGWQASLTLLAAMPATVQRGLHFNLTEGKPVSSELLQYWPRFLSLPKLILAAHLRQLPLEAVALELRAQWQVFVDATGAAPQFVDGHQHVHHLPGVRQLLLELVTSLSPVPAVRATGRLLGQGEGLKRFLIQVTGGAALQRTLARQAIRHNPCLVGAYDFIDTDYASRMRGWLAVLPAEGGLLFCHPGVQGPPHTVVDPIAAARLREWAYLRSDAFAQDLRSADVVLGAL